MSLHPTPSARRMPHQGAAKAPGLRLPTGPAWVALVHPAIWEPVEDDEGRWHVLPSPMQLMLMPGVNGVKEGRDVEGRRVPSARDAVHDLSRDGYVEVPPLQVTAFGRVHPDYCVRYQVVGGTTHLWAWVRPEIAAGGRSATRVDRNAKVAFLTWCRDELLGMKGPEQDVLESLQSKALAEARRLVVQARTNPAKAEKLARVARRLRGLGWDQGIDFEQPVAQPPVQRAPVDPFGGVSLEQALRDPALRSQLLAMLQPPTPAPASAPAAPPASEVLVSSGGRGAAAAPESPAPMPEARGHLEEADGSEVAPPTDDDGEVDVPPPTPRPLRRRT